MALKTGAKLFKSTHEKPALFPHAENLQPGQKVRKFEFPARKIQKNLMINNFDCSSFCLFTHKMNFIHISPNNFI